MADGLTVEESLETVVAKFPSMLSQARFGFSLSSLQFETAREKVNQLKDVVGKLSLISACLQSSDGLFNFD